MGRYLDGRTSFLYVLSGLGLAEGNDAHDRSDALRLRHTGLGRARGPVGATLAVARPRPLRSPGDVREFDTGRHKGVSNKGKTMNRTCTCLALAAALSASVWAADAPVRIDPAVLAGQGLEALPPRDPAFTVSQQDDKSSFKSVFEGDIVSAVFESSPAVLKIEDLWYDEFIYILEGGLVLTGTDGVAHTFETGDYLVLPKGWSGTWEMVGETFRELIVIETQTYLESMQELGIDP